MKPVDFTNIWSSLLQQPNQNCWLSWNKRQKVTVGSAGTLKWALSGTFFFLSWRSNMWSQCVGHFFLSNSISVHQEINHSISGFKANSSLCVRLSSLWKDITWYWERKKCWVGSGCEEEGGMCFHKDKVRAPHLLPPAAAPPWKLDTMQMCSTQPKKLKHFGSFEKLKC